MTPVQVEGVAIITQMVYVSIVGWVVIAAIVGHWLYKKFRMTDQELRVAKEYRRIKREERINSARFRPRL